MKGKQLLTTIALSTILFTGCGIKTAQTIIKVNGESITQKQYDTSFEKAANNNMLTKLGIDLKNNQGGFLYYLIKDKVVNELIVKELLRQEIQKREIKVSNDEVEEAVKEIVDKVGSKEKLNEILKTNNMTTSQFKKDLTEQVGLKKLSQQLTDGAITEADTKKFYKDNLAQFKYPAKVKASHILVSMDPKEIEEIITSDVENAGATKEQIKKKVDAEIANRKAKADKLLAEAKKAPKQFAQLAKENSDDVTTAVNGGDLGFFTYDEMVPEFSKAAFSLKPNVISNVVKTSYGYHIIMVTDRMEAGQEPYEKVKNDIKAFMENQKQLEALDKLVESLKKNATIEYVNQEFDPAEIQKSLQNEVKEQSDKANEEKNSNKTSKEAKPAPKEVTNKK